MRFVRLSLWLVLTLAAAGCSGTPADPAPTSPASVAELAQVVAGVQGRAEVYDGIATGVVALVRVDDATEVVTSGRADRSSKQPMTAEQTFPIASITKPMVATLVMQLVGEGRVAADDDLRRLLPPLRSLERPVTVEQVLSHRAGLVRDPTESAVERWGTDATDKLVEAGAREGLRFPPGEDGRYSNLGYAALGLLIERVLHQPLGRALEERVFAPAGMTHTSLGGAPTAQGYAPNGPVRNYYLDYLPAAGSVVSTAGDVDAFFTQLWHGDLVPSDVVADMRTSRGQVEVGLGFRPEYGLGLMRWNSLCGVALGHSGRIGGFTIEAWTLETGERSTVVMVNDNAADEVARPLAQTALCEG